MTQKNDGGPAFPTLDNNGGGLMLREWGMTMRDKIVIDCISASFGVDPSPLTIQDGQTPQEALREHWDAVVFAAHIAADAIISARGE